MANISKITVNNTTYALRDSSTYTRNEVDNLISSVVANLDWKESINTYADLATMYPAPEDGWTVNVKDTDVTYRYTGDTWIAISANAVPVATDTTTGLLTSADYQLFSDANSKKHTHSNKVALDSITESKIQTWDNANSYTDAQITLLKNSGTFPNGIQIGPYLIHYDSASGNLVTEYTG